MKKHIYILIIFSFGLLLFANQSVFGQFERMEINYNVEEIIVDGSTSYNLTIYAASARTKISYSLYSEKLNPDNLIKKTKAIKDKEYLFKNLSAGKYYIAIYESKIKGGFETIYIGNSKISAQ